MPSNLINPSKDVRAYVKKLNSLPFYEWLGKAHPYLKLLPWQEEAIEIFMNDIFHDHARGSGKSFLIKMLYEYDKSTQQRSLSHDQ